MPIADYIKDAVRVGVATLGPVDDEAEAIYRQWIARGKHGEMNYLANHPDVRHDPRLLLSGARSIIVAAFSYNHPLHRSGPLKWAGYATGRDYHETVRRILTEAADRLTTDTGAQCRVTVDTAPLRERYWAIRAGVGFIGVNNQLIVPGHGSRCVLGEIITTLPLTPDRPNTDTCLHCMKCVKACPGQALDGLGGMDARRCLSYLTIEKRIPPSTVSSGAPTSPGPDTSTVTPTSPGHDTSTVTMPDGSPARLGGCVYGCDVCQDVCPHNQGVPPTAIGDFAPRPEILALTRDDILAMTQPDFSRIFSHSAIKRTKLSGLQRNARSLQDPEATQPE